MNIREVAKLAGVSVSTVSKIINQKDASIGSETRERVLKIAREYNYVPYGSTINPTAKTWLIGVLINSTADNDRIVSGIIDIAQKNGYTVIICESHGDSVQELKNITALCKNRVDGVLWKYSTPESATYVSQFDHFEIPYLTFYSTEANTNIIDYENLGYRATNTLLENKHTLVACLLAQGKRTQMFLDGYKKCLFDHRIMFDEELIYQEITESLIYKLGNHKISGIVCSHFSKALSLYEIVDTLHYQIPYDISLISLKDDSRNAVNFPHISTYTIPNLEFGQYLCNKLIHFIEKRETAIKDFQPSIQLDNDTTIDIPFSLKAKRIAVVGSINIDTFLSVETLPQSGKTVSTSTSSVYPGGKGINQAIGSSKLGHCVTLIGNVGSGLDSDQVYATIKEYGIDPLGIKRCHNISTGKAYIFVQPNGDSMISILSGANGIFTPMDIRDKQFLFENTGYCLVQTEIPLDTVYEALLIAHEYKAKTILKPSTCGMLPEHILKEIDILVPNYSELTILCPEETQLELQAASLIAKGVNTVIVTLGNQGCYCKTSGWEEYFKASQFPSVDNTGASDAFISALASYLLYGYSLRQSIQIATYAAGFSITREGVVPALIDKSSLEAYIQQMDPNLIHPGINNVPPMINDGNTATHS
ncbi:MAG: PfkB family carbohydrate kinase [Acetivibrio sp.]